MRRIEKEGKIYYEVMEELYTEEEYERKFLTKTSTGNSLIKFPELHSEALAVHPTQIQEAIDLAKARGVPTEFDGQGRPVFKSSRHFREYAKKHGFRHRGY